MEVGLAGMSIRDRSRRVHVETRETQDQQTTCRLQFRVIEKRRIGAKARIV